MEKLFKVLGDENRLRIINLLCKGELCVCDIEEILNTTQSNVSRHLTKLRNEEVVIFEKRSQWAYYQINPVFIENNTFLYQYLLEKMNENEKFKSDLERLLKYEENESDCDKNTEKISIDTKSKER
ncbi:metalloregulator ArsR/SmtB family transcription factor [Jeotgalibaca sp. MA1X17-3]|uniref:ArsR/SmtB family transcription factor n=1 Tax=Jeotgalibaca sp. MA1X17-3 TaxID=2908211 RepID=UPI001F3620AD|nr:metalloregulator ArsR/SmtB family transcription factor [Jeotgalibaca sp. MA1X17-3]UJF16476.1 metalloregulator ArsR/SmtB family transcription factor [Jeotgalibaca sp. MA1X17-3]